MGVISRRVVPEAGVLPPAPARVQPGDCRTRSFWRGAEPLPGLAEVCCFLRWPEGGALHKWATLSVGDGFSEGSAEVSGPLQSLGDFVQAANIRVGRNF